MIARVVIGKGPQASDFDLGEGEAVPTISISVNHGGPRRKNGAHARLLPVTLPDHYQASRQVENDASRQPDAR